ncbi:MAG TPA: hypothetical protein DC054_01775 [Blastocatellia bacterium]|nr:hypothetical protein [Blastocatellia bacterium]
MKLEESEYINQGPLTERCDYIFIVDEQINLVEKAGSVRVFSTRGKKCGLERDPKGTQGYCYWHESEPGKSKDPHLKKTLEIAVKQKVYLGGAFLSGGGPGTYYVDSEGPMDLTGANLQGAFFAGAYFEGTILQGVNLREAHLESAWFGSTNLSGADLSGAHLWGTDFQFANMKGTELWNAEINGGTQLGGAYWGDDYVLAAESGGRLGCAEETYRILKQHRQESGDYRTAGQFYFREMESIRKQLTRFRRLLWTVFFKSICGYGERPTWTFGWAVGVILVWGGLLLPLGGIHNPDGSTTQFSWPPNFAILKNGLSLSLITFVTLGYGNRYPDSAAGEFLAGFEALLGILLLSIFVVSFAKKVIRG